MAVICNALLERPLIPSVMSESLLRHRGSVIGDSVPTRRSFLQFVQLQTQAG